MISILAQVYMMANPCHWSFPTLNANSSTIQYYNKGEKLDGTVKTALIQFPTNNFCGPSGRTWWYLGLEAMTNRVDCSVVVVV